MTEIAKNSMNFGGHLSHKFAIFWQFFFYIDLQNEVNFSQRSWIGVSSDSSTAHTCLYKR